MYDYFAPDRRQAAQSQALMDDPQFTPEEKQSLLAGLYESGIGGLGYLGKILDKTFGGRAVRGLLGGSPEELLSIIPLSDTLGLTDEKNAVQGTSLLDQIGLTSPGDDSWGRTLGGLGAEMLFDPSTYLGIGPLTKLGQGAIKAGTATKGLSAGIRAGERGLVGFGLPFMRPTDDFIFGAGRTGKAVDPVADLVSPSLRTVPPSALDESGMAIRDDILGGMGIDPPAAVAPPVEDIDDFIAKAFGAADRRSGGAAPAPGGVERRGRTLLGPPEIASKPDAGGNTLTRHPVFDEGGQEIGDVKLFRSGDTLHVDWAGLEGAGATDKAAKGAAGSRKMMQAIEQLALEYPDAALVKYTPAFGRPDAGVTRYLELEKFRNRAARKAAPDPVPSAGGATPPDRAVPPTAPSPAGLPPDATVSDPGSAGAADFVDFVSKWGGRLARAPLDAAQYAAKPAEWLLGVNPVAKAREAGAAIGRYGKTLFHTPVEQATSAIGQKLAAGEYGPTVRAYSKPSKELMGDVAVTVDTLGKQLGPEAQRAINRGLRIATELPTEVGPKLKWIDEEYHEKVRKLIDGTDSVPADVARSRQQKFERQYQRLTDPQTRPAIDSYLPDLLRTADEDRKILDPFPAVPYAEADIRAAAARQAKRDADPQWREKAQAKADAAFQKAMGSRLVREERIARQKAQYDLLNQLGIEGPNVFRLPRSTMGKIDEAGVVRDHLRTVTELGQQYRQANDPIAIWEKHVSPDQAQMLMGKANEMRMLNDTMLDVERRFGIDSKEYRDAAADYMTRQKNVLSQGAGENWFTSQRRQSQDRNAAADPFQNQRLEAFANLPGGTDQWEQMVSDPALRSLTDDQRATAIRAILSGSESPAKGSPVWEQARTLAAIIGKADPRHATEGLPYFSPDMAQMVKARGAAHARKMGLAQTIYQGAANYSLTEAELKAKGIEGVKVRDLLNQAKMQSPQAAKDVWQPIADRLGAELKDVGERFLPMDVAKDMMRMGTAWRSNEAMAPVIQAVGMVMDAFKTGVTAPFPSFHVRNLGGGEFNKWRGEAQSYRTNVDTINVLKGGYLSKETASALEKAHPQYFKGMSPEQATEQLKKLAVGYEVAFTRANRGTTDFIGQTDRLLPYELPTTTGTAKSNMQVLKDTFSTLLPTKEGVDAGYSKARQLLDPFATQGVGADRDFNTVIKTGREVGRQTEDYLRLSHFTEKLKQGFIPQAAAEEVAKYQLDYSNLTQFEKNVMKRIAPWYSFSRRNLPPLLEDLATQPAKLATTVRAITGARDPEDFTPQYIAEGASFPLGQSAPGVSRFISSFGTPVEDEAVKTIGSLLKGDSRRTLQQLLGMIRPEVKAPFEQAFDTQLYSGRRLSDLEPSTVASLGGLLPERLAQLSSQAVANTPFARVASTADRFLDDRKGTVPTALNALTGVRVSDVDLQRSQMAAQRTMVQDLLRPSQESKIRESVYIPREELQNLDARERMLYLLYGDLNKQISAAARERQAAGQR